MTTHPRGFAVVRLIPSAFFSLLLAHAARAEELKRPNVVFILADDLGCEFLSSRQREIVLV